MRKPNHNRAIYYGCNDSAAGIFRDRCLAALAGAKEIGISSINDAIEAHQIRQTVEGVPEIFQDPSIDDLPKRARILFSKACSFVASALESKGVDALYNQTEQQYSDQFWQLMEACGAWERMEACDFKKLLENHPECIGAVLQYRKPLDYLDEEIGQTLLDNPNHSAELIIGRLAAESAKQTAIHLPSSMENSDIDSVMLKYIDSETANPNYLAILRGWPIRQSDKYRPSPEVRVKAKRKYERLTEDLFKNGTGLKYGTSVVIDMNQIPCKGIEMGEPGLTYRFGGHWLEKYTDPATVMNNLIYIFDFVNPNGLMLAPARRHEERGLLSAIGMHAKGEYRTPIGFRMRSSLTYIETNAYADFLEDHGARLETALEWVYNQYFSKEFGISGFSLALPSKEASWLDKCKAIGPEIERAVKAYSIYSKQGEIDDEFFPYESVKSFSCLKALKKKKYAIAGPDFERRCNALFSDQHLLSYLHKESISEPCFFDMAKKTCRHSKGLRGMAATGHRLSYRQ